MLFKLLGLPLTLPAAGIKFCFQQVLNTAEKELTDDEPVKEALLLLTLKLEEGEIGEEEFAREEAVLHARLREIKAYREAKMKEALAKRQAALAAQQPPLAGGADREPKVASARGARIEVTSTFGQE
ncbi:MAG TPA: gas vesicle protein GvpG [Chloroflexota bacterium]|nr:gas vesicle protein GvpG [Chloroflexota bacterium]